MTGQGHVSGRVEELLETSWMVWLIEGLLLKQDVVVCKGLFLQSHCPMDRWECPPTSQPVPSWSFSSAPQNHLWLLYWLLIVMENWACSLFLDSVAALWAQVCCDFLISCDLKAHRW